jgi:hypothetical protein
MGASCADRPLLATGAEPRRIPVAGADLGVWDVNEQGQGLIRAREPADVGALSDPETPLESLAGELTAGG